MNQNLLKKFLSSFKFDFRLAKYDIQSCIAWTELLIKNKIVDKAQGEKVIKILKKINRNPKKVFPEEDIHFAVEKTLEKFLGKQKHLAGVIRTARSRNDLVVSDERMFLKEEIIEIIKLLKNLILTIVKLAEKNFDIPIVGYTHLQPAQPVLFSHYILSFAWWFLRDIERLQDCYKRVDVSVLGSAAFAGSSFEVDREEIAKKLGFSKISENSVDSVSDRDFIIEFISCCSIIMMHLSRTSEELIIWCNPNFGYISLPKELTSGSSIMPQKQNPDYLELIRGKSAKAYSDLIGILVLMKALPLSYNRDMQEDKVYLFSCVDTTKQCLEIIDMIFSNLNINIEKLKKDLESYDFILATEIANFFVKEMKYTFKFAHKKVQQLLNFCVENKKSIRELNFDEYKNLVDKKFTKEMFSKLQEILDIKNLAENYKTYGGSSINHVKNQIKNINNLLKKIQI